jgi:hypothetical protein
VTDTLIEREPESAPSELPASADAPAPADDLDSLLQEYENATGQAEPTASDSPVQEDAPAQDESVDSFLDSLNKDARRVTELEGEIGSLRAAELDRQSRADFEGFSKKLQAALGPNVDENFARTNLLALAAENPALEAAWRYRNLSDADRRSADLEFQRLELLYHQMQQAPDDPRKAAAMAQMERRGQELGLMMNAHKILNNTWREVQKRAAKVLPPIDELVSADHAAVAFAVREASSGDIPEPKPNFGIMSDREFRDYTRKHFGF